MTPLKIHYKNHLEELEWLKAYSKSSLSNEDKLEMLEHYLTMFDIPKSHQLELVAGNHTMIPELPLYSMLERYCKAMGLYVEYIKVGQKEQLFLRMPKGFLK